jgi:uncharacterized membrane protein
LSLLWWSGFRLAKIIGTPDKIGILGAYFAGLFLMINPRVYARMMDGQILIVASLACLSMGLGYLCANPKSPSFRKAGIWFGMAIWMMIHAVFFVLLIMLIAYICTLYHLDKDSIKKLTISYILCGWTIILMNSFWLLGSQQNNDSLAVLDHIDQRHIQAFVTQPWNTHVLVSSLAGFGFWWEAQARFKSIQATKNHARIYLFGLIFGLSCIGIYALYQEKRYRLICFLLLLWGSSYILWVGISQDTFFAPISKWLYDTIPFYIGLREPQKWIWILMIYYAVTGAYAIDRIQARFLDHKKLVDQIILWFLMCLPLMYTPYMLFAAIGQLTPRQYPSSRYELKTTMDSIAQPNQYATGYDILVLPRHMYQSFHFSHGEIAHPLSNFFDQQRTLVGDNMEMQDIYTQSSRPASKIIEASIGKWWFQYQSGDINAAKNFISDCKLLGLQYILLLKEVDRKKYSDHLAMMQSQWLVHTIQDQEHFILYSIP